MAISAPAPQNNPPDPQVPVGERVTVSETFDRRIFGQQDPAGFKEFRDYEITAQRALVDKYRAEEAARLGLRPNDFLGTELTDAINRTATQQAEDAARQRFAPQIIAAGAGTSETTTTPLFAQQPQPPITPTNTAPVNPATNPQVPAPAAANTPAVAVPVTVNNPPNPQVPEVAGSTVTAVTNLNEGRFRANDPAGYAQFQAYQKERQAYETNRLTQAELARSGRTSLTGRQRSIVNADAAELSRNEAIRQFTPQIQAANAAIITTTVVPPTTATRNSAGAVNSATDPAAREFTNTAGGAAIGIRRVPAVEQAAGTANAQKQAPVQAQTSQPTSADWRVRLKLAPQSKYLYNAEQPGILQPLKVTNGIIFPYTPQITTQYLANYSPYNLTHSNFKGYFYQGSNVSEIKITCPFTAQDTFEANYLLAVIHFFRSATKMFYGATDAFRGAPPPLVFLSGLGEFQFNNHACAIQSFDYTLPADVDYIRADTSNNTGTTLAQKRDRQNLPISSNNTSGNRLQNAGLYPGGIPILPAPTQLGTASPTYVPTKMDISITLLPMQTRVQVSQQFSMEKFANGNLLKGGFW
jgi:hypothetical protein